MADYRLINRGFSREWRRSKKYRNHEIKWLAKRRGLEVRSRNRALEVFDPKTGKTVVSFKEIGEPAMPVSERSQMFAALKR
jgi:hypothetical protein